MAWVTGHRYIGSGSWWFTEAIEQAPLAALFVRDTVGLDVPTGGVIPPQLEGRLPNNSHLLDPRTRAAAAAAWTGWWEAVLTQDIRQHQHRPADLDQRVWMRQLAAEYQTVFDPPDFIGLTDRPALREAVMATRDQALGWSDVRRRALLSPRHARNGQFDQLSP